MADKIKNSKAAALRYDPDRDDAPIIAALGMGHVAERIIESAKKYDVPIVEDKQLSDMLVQLSVGDIIPTKLYEAVAQVLVYISQQDGGFRDKIKY
jgi:flagellar biosynthesis protein